MNYDEVVILRRETSHAGEGEPQPVWRVFLETQKRTGPPSAIVFQAEHARLAGAIAKCLLPEIFGDLPPDVIDAIAAHDDGWQSADEAGISDPKPFPMVPGEESNTYWHESVRLAEDRSVLAGAIVRRHFCALALGDPSHHAFLAKEAPRAEAVEVRLRIPRSDLDRWTAAIGFCDVVSLYLCSGAVDPVVIPLAHPALPAARDARKVQLQWGEGSLRFSQPVVRPGTRLSAETVAPQALVSWQFADIR